MVSNNMGVKMVMLQILKQLDEEQQVLFMDIFTIDWVGEANILGCSSDTELGDFVKECLEEQLGFSVQDQCQLNRLVEVLKNPESLRSALKITEEYMRTK